MGKKWVREVSSQHVCCCPCAMQMRWIQLLLNLAGEGAAALLQRTNHQNTGFIPGVQVPHRIDLNESAAGLRAGWEPPCQHRTVNGSENVAPLPPPFTSVPLPTTPHHTVPLSPCPHSGAGWPPWHTQTFSSGRRPPLLWGEGYKSQWCHSQGVPGPPRS